MIFVTCLIFLIANAQGLSLSASDFFDLSAKDTNNEFCEAQKDAYFNGITEGKDWALQMLDATGKIPSGLFRGAIFELGFYDQCMDIRHQSDDIDIKGKYCYASLLIPYGLLLNTNDSLENAKDYIQQDFIQDDIDSALKTARAGIIGGDDDLPAISSGILLSAVCIPDQCSPSDIFGFLGLEIYQCETKGETRKLDNVDIACLVFLGVILLLMVSSTTYDVYLYYNDKTCFQPIFLAFSVYSNTKKILRTSNDNSNQIGCINGIKTLSMFWVIAGHTAGYKLFPMFSMDFQDGVSWFQNWYAVYLTQGPLAVDSFFFVSGALLSYNFVNTMKKPGANFNIFLFYIHRYLRLTPALAALFIVVVSIARRIGNGPMFLTMADQARDVCLNNWWPLFLYVQNYVGDGICILQSWYLAADMQLFFFSPILLYFVIKFPKITVRFLIPIIAFSAILASFLLHLLQSETPNNFHTHLKIAQWVIGVAFGVILLQAQKQRLLISTKFNCLMWILSLAIMATIMFTLNEVTYNNPTKLKSAFYLSMHKVAWVTCLGWICFACVNGNGGIINWFLSNAFFQVMGKLTYSIYLVHMTIITMMNAQRRYRPNVSDFELIYDIVGTTVISTFVGYIWMLAFESPVFTLEKALLGGGCSPKINAEKDDNQITAIQIQHENMYPVHEETSKRLDEISQVSETQMKVDEAQVQESGLQEENNKNEYLQVQGQSKWDEIYPASSSEEYMNKTK